jgi:hypothetical protein
MVGSRRSQHGHSRDASFVATVEGQENPRLRVVARLEPKFAFKFKADERQRQALWKPSDFGAAVWTGSHLVGDSPADPSVRHPREQRGCPLEELPSRAPMFWHQIAEARPHEWCGIRDK